LISEKEGGTSSRCQARHSLKFLTLLVQKYKNGMRMSKARKIYSITEKQADEYQNARYIYSIYLLSWHKSTKTDAEGALCC
jgi:hypothetical protein